MPARPEIVLWGGKRKGAGRPKKEAKTRYLRVIVQASTYAAIIQQSFNLGVSRGEVIDQQFTRENKHKKS